MKFSRINMNTKLSNRLLTKLNLIIILFIAFLSHFNTFAQTGWYNLNFSTGVGGIYFKDINNGIIVPYKTTNAGINWSYMNTLIGGNFINFPSPNTGYGIGGSFIAKTTNFGDNWVSQSNPTNQNLNSINFPNVNIGYACGEAGKIIKTNNGGDNWFIVNNPLNINYNLYNVHFADTETGYVSGITYFLDTSVFMKTTNGGNNWSVQYYLPSNWGWFTAMFFVNSSTGYIGAASHNYMLKTTNGGVNWLQYNIPTANGIYSIHFPSANIGYASCYSGQIIKTTNTGVNWFLQITSTGSSLRSIFFLNDLTGYCSGDNNTVLKTTDGGGAPIGITPISNEVPKDFMLEQNYPNPFNPVTNINFSIPKAGYTSIRIYDIMGRLVHTLFETQLAPGSYKADWNASQMPSGIYIYRIESGSFTESKKMILIK